LSFSAACTAATFSVPKNEGFSLGQPVELETPINYPIMRWLVETAGAIKAATVANVARDYQPIWPIRLRIIEL
jgi:hypothetical protein